MLQGDHTVALDTLPELRLLSSLAEAARHALKWQRSQGLPQLAVQGEYDKNGNIGHNFYAVGLSVALPLWNRNRGNIRSAVVWAVYDAARNKRPLCNMDLHRGVEREYQKMGKVIPYSFSG